MSNQGSVKTYIQQEAAVFRGAVSESLIQSLGGSINWLLDLFLQTSGGVNLAGKSVQENGNNVVVSNTNASTNSLAIIRGSFSSSGSALTGEGYTSTQASTGVYTITFSQSFLDTPIIIPTGDLAQAIANVTSKSTSGCTITVANGTQNIGCSFIAIGQRT